MVETTQLVVHDIAIVGYCFISVSEFQNGGHIFQWSWKHRTLKFPVFFSLKTFLAEIIQCEATHKKNDQRIQELFVGLKWKLMGWCK